MDFHGIHSRAGWGLASATMVWLRLALAMVLVALVTPAKAGENDPSASTLESRKAPGETTKRVCLRNGFILVQFFDSNGKLVSALESSTTCKFEEDAEKEEEDEEASLDAGQAAGAVDAVLQAIVPGALDGNLFGDFGITQPFFDPLRVFKDCRARLADLEAEEKEAARRVAEAKDRVQRARGVLINAIHKLAIQSNRVDAARQSERRAAVLGNEARQFAEQKTLGARLDRHFASEDRKKAERDLAREEGRLAAETAALQRIRAAIASFPCRGGNQTASADAAATGGLTQLALGGPAAGVQPFLLAPAEPAGLGARLRRNHAARYASPDRRFNSWVNGGVVFHSDNRAAFGQDGETAVVSGGASYLVTPNINVGLAARYGDTDVSGKTGATEAETWSGAAFAQVRLPNDFALAGMLAYSDVDVDTRFLQNAVFTSGQTNAESLAGQILLSRPIDLSGVTLTPVLGASFVNIDRDAFRASDGTAIAGSDSTQVLLTTGATLSARHIFVRPNGQIVTMTPSAGISGFTNLGLFDPLIGLTGAESEDDTFGLSFNTAIEFQFGDGGTTLGVGAAFAGVGTDERNIQILGGLAVPF